MKSCNQCGKCCIKYSDGGLSATADEIAWWESARPGIASFILDAAIWFDPATGQQLPRCPWLQPLPGHKKYGCAIYFDRPDDCKYYPVSIQQMIDDECEMLEVRDLRRPVDAQKTLDALMADSRPPFGS